MLYLFVMIFVTIIVAGIYFKLAVKTQTFNVYNEATLENKIKDYYSFAFLGLSIATILLSVIFFKML